LNPRLKTGLKAGCISLSLVGMILMGGLIFFMREMGQNYKTVEATEETLLEAYGQPADYAPPGLGIPSADRIDAFLSVRESGAEWRQNMETTFREFLAAKGDGSQGGVGHFFGLLRATSDLSPALAGFWTARNAALLAADMGPGEYIWIYCLAYHAWLGFDPGDGARESWAVMEGIEYPAPEDAVQAQQLQRDMARQRVAAAMLPVMRNIEVPTVLPLDTDLVIWTTELQDQIVQMESDPLHVPWVGHLPTAAAAAFSPHEARLRAGFSLAVNPIELMFGPVFGGAEPE